MEIIIPKTGDIVFWKWANNIIQGTVLSINYDRTQIISKDKLITRNGKLDNPAIIILYKNNIEVLKLASELMITT